MTFTTGKISELFGSSNVITRKELTDFVEYWIKLYSEELEQEKNNDRNILITWMKYAFEVHNGKNKNK